jgi:hypothetical protein
MTLPPVASDLLQLRRRRPGFRGHTPRGQECASGGQPVLWLLAWGYIRVSLRNTAQPLHTQFPNIFGRCFSEVTIGSPGPSPSEISPSKSSSTAPSTSQFARPSARVPALGTQARRSEV